jgi:uncharacterized protein YxeA
MGYIDELKKRAALAKAEPKNNKIKTILVFVISSLVSLFFIIAGTYVWYTRNYLPSNYGIKTIGIVYERTSGRLSAWNVSLYYKVNGITYDVMGGVNSYENFKNRRVEIGDTFCVLYYPTHHEWSCVDFFANIPIDTLQEKD